MYAEVGSIDRKTDFSGVMGIATRTVKAIYIYGWNQKFRGGQKREVVVAWLLGFLRIEARRNKKKGTTNLYKHEKENYWRVVLKPKAIYLTFRRTNAATTELCCRNLVLILLILTSMKREHLQKSRVRTCLSFFFFGFGSTKSPNICEVVVISGKGVEFDLYGYQRVVRSAPLKPPFMIMGL